jgi:hypothetical protein
MRMNATPATEPIAMPAMTPAPREPDCSLLLLLPITVVVTTSIDVSDRETELDDLYPVPLAIVVAVRDVSEGETELDDLSPLPLAIVVVVTVAVSVSKTEPGLALFVLSLIVLVATDMIELEVVHVDPTLVTSEAAVSLEERVEP